MNIVICAEPKPETRVTVTPKQVASYITLGFNVLCVEGAGEKSGFSDQEYQTAGAAIGRAKSALPQSDIFLCLTPPNKTMIKLLKSGCLVVTQLQVEDATAVEMMEKKEISVIDLHAIPRISRAQSMDVLSSQSNLAGYKAALLACNTYEKVVPMMMTAAGMIHPSRALVLGAGVAGLQAIATLKRLGAAVKAFDVREAAREQVESLGAEFVAVEGESLEGEDGYAKEASDDYKEKQAALIHATALESDIIITTALIPNRPAPLLLSEETIASMPSGAVVVDLATARGGNVSLSEKDKSINHDGVQIIGYSNLAGNVPTTASLLYANNVYQFIKLIAKDKGTIQLDSEDIIIQKSLISHQGKRHPFVVNTEEQTE